MRLTHRGPVNMDIVLYITNVNVYLRWNCFVLFQVSPRYLNWTLYQHPICGSKYWPGTEQASCHYMKQRWPFWQMHMWVIWPQWVGWLLLSIKISKTGKLRDYFMDNYLHPRKAVGCNFSPMPKLRLLLNLGHTGVITCKTVDVITYPCLSHS